MAASERRGEPIALDEHSAEPIWKRTLDRLTGLVADSAAAANKLSVDAQGRLVASFPESRKFSRDSCLRPANLSRIEAALAEVCGGRVGLVLTTHDDPADAAPRRRRGRRSSSSKPTRRRSRLCSGRWSCSTATPAGCAWLPRTDNSRVAAAT